MRSLLLMCSVILCVVINAAEDNQNNHWSTKRVEGAQEPYPFTNALYDFQGYKQALQLSPVEEIDLNNDLVMTVHHFVPGIQSGKRWLEFLKFNKYELPEQEKTYRIIVWAAAKPETMITFADMQIMLDRNKKKLINTGTYLREYVQDEDLYKLGTPQKKLMRLQALKKIMLAHDHIIEKMRDLADKQSCAAIRIECSGPAADPYYQREHHFEYIREKWEKRVL